MYGLYDIYMAKDAVKRKQKTENKSDPIAQSEKANHQATFTLLDMAMSRPICPKRERGADGRLPTPGLHVVE